MKTSGDSERNYRRHSQTSVILPVGTKSLFEFLDNHENLSEHMEAKKSLMMFGGSMHLILDEDRGQAIGSHIKMDGKVLGIRLYLDEVVTERMPFRRKVWETIVADLLVIGHYRLGFDIEPVDAETSRLTVHISYNLPSKRTFLGLLGGAPYARWCVTQMLSAATKRFSAVEPGR
jgi:hypothetical protein